MRKYLISLLASLAAMVATGLAIPAFGQVRSIPDETRRATMTHVRDLVVTLDGTAVNLAAGVQIRGTSNMLILPSQLPRDSLVKYLTDSTGLITRVWVLSAEEAAQRDKPRPNP